MNEFKKWKKDYIEHLQPRTEMLVNAGELTQRRMEAAWLAGQAAEREACAKIAFDCDISPSQADSNGCLTNIQDNWAMGTFDAAEQISAAIRARGEGL